MELPIIILVIFFVIILIIAYICSESILCYYHELPIDSYVIRGLTPEFNPKVDERIKQVWTFMFAPASHNILEFGFGNTTSSVNLNKRLHSSSDHLIVIPPNREKYVNLLEINRKVTHTQFHTTTPEMMPPAHTLDMYKTVIVHMDGQHIFWDHLKNNEFSLFKTAKVLIMEMDIDLLVKMKPILQLHDFKKEKTHIYLSIWYKQKKKD